MLTKEREGTRVMTVDAGVAAFIIRTIKPIIEEVRTEFERDDIPPLLKEVLMKKRLSLEMLVHVLRGNKSSKQKYLEDKEQGHLTENEIDVDQWIVIARNPHSGDEDLFSHVYSEDAARAEQFELQSEGYEVELMRVVPHIGRDIEVFWPVEGEELEEWRAKSTQVEDYRELKY